MFDKKRKKLKVELDIQKITKYFYLITFVSTITILTYISLFLYNNFYQTIIQSEIILSLQEKVAPETVNMSKFNKLIESLDNKIKGEEAHIIKNPFE